MYKIPRFTLHLNDYPPSIALQKSHDIRFISIRRYKFLIFSIRRGRSEARMINISIFMVVKLIPLVDKTV